MKRILVIPLLSIWLSSSSLGAESDKQFFVDSILAAKNANAISAELPRIQDEQGEVASQKKEEEMIALMEKSIADGSMVADTLLEDLHPELRTHFRDSLMNGQVTYLEGRRDADPVKQANAIERLMTWGKFWTENNSQILNKLDVKQGLPVKAGFWRFAIKLFIAYFACGLVYLFANIVLVRLLAILSTGVKGLVKNKILESVFLTPFDPISLIFKIFFWGLWAAFLSALAIKHSAMPGVSHAWIYFLVAFIGCHLPTVFRGDQPKNPPIPDRLLLQLVIVHFICVVEVFVAFIVFCAWPDLALWPYGWALKFLV